MTFNPWRQAGHEIKKMMIPFTKDSFKVNFINGFLEELVKHFLFIYLTPEPGLRDTKMGKATRGTQWAGGGLSSTESWATNLSSRPGLLMVLREG